ncbi:MAG: hypothetical protein J5I94_21420 [Phaeodactylibacter sp.]|nr:hypothetical protein [Phaeodactylibacter sp.]
MNIVVNLNKQLEGYTFSLSPRERARIKEKFPDANPVASIFVNFDVKGDFEEKFGSIKKYLFPFLSGLDEQTASELEVELVDSATQQKVEA